MAMTNLSFGVDEKKLSRTDRAFFRNLRQHAIFAEPGDQLRVYPNGPLAAQVLGFVGVGRSDRGRPAGVRETVGPRRHRTGL